MTAPTEGVPTTLVLPDGFQPEGITIGKASIAYLGSLADGSIYRLHLGSGRGRLVSVGSGTPSAGLKLDRHGRLFVAGAFGGDFRVIHALTGELLASYRFAPAQASFFNPVTLVNDVVLTPSAAWITESYRPVLYRLPFGPLGQLPGSQQAETIELSGDIRYAEGLNANGIARTPDGRALLIVQTNTGLLFRVDPETGVARVVDLGGALLTNGDGLLLAGQTLFAVNGLDNAVAVVHLDVTGRTGRLVRWVSDERLDVPTAVAAFDGRLYLPNARFGTPPEKSTSYSVVAIPQP